jgi:dTDP-4-dehydrorhamnose 3,5-epimerase
MGDVAMSSLRLQRTPLTGLTVITTAPITDERGQFVRIFCEAEMSHFRPGLHFTQINVSTTRRSGTIRGMHFQRPPMAEAKLIRCLRGRVFDVAIDLRVGSPTFLSWHGIELSENDPTQIFIPEGFAHGFQAITDDVQLLYMHTAPWSQEHESGLRPDDPTLAIHWPLAATQLSERDRSRPLLDDSFTGIQL